ncbi:MAG TPA: hypothetical protein VLF18_07975 [Tahibacter sp.]|uniref:hypothetical protein n=1 Tax=Tahibacter sp. TaxID=2056211 RepID=UPI002C7DBC2C|nr:hypothetical protein [Tahibacter sp.]HSX60119.1 hypothetical protein [Tahibacter sp.]
MSARRLYRRSLAALLVVAPLALWSASGNDWMAYRRSLRVAEITVAAGGAQDYGGSTWRIERHSVHRGELPAVDGAKTLTTVPRSLPAGTSLVRVRVAVRAGDAEAVRRLDRCTLELVDADGRRWNPQNLQPERRREVATRCNGSYSAPPQVAQDFVFEQDFLVPNDAAGRVDARVRIGAEPQLLRLQLR